MHGLGNDYLFIDARRLSLPDNLWQQYAVAMSDRHFGVGSDGIILITESDRAPVGMRIFNSDGSESEMCGNGLRAMTKWLYDRGELTPGQGIETGAGVLYPEIVATDGSRASVIRVNMGPPGLTRAEIGMAGDPKATCIEEPFDLDGTLIHMTGVSMGNPHVIVFGPLWNPDMMTQIGSRIENHTMFPKRTNVHSVEIVDTRHLRMRHWERGAGLTLACGTGVCAAIVAAVLTGRVEREVSVEVPGGTLDVAWDERSGNVFLTGTAQEVCEGTFEVK
ncbi:MAG: diaminopimelate epimerase [Sulfobacillus benefaciens]|jgi:diaminopimelate epimerase|uniref:Diaminopimelate epimerase n=1 Tax=Sulfobacillus benefaciens TaxID=453960 RepID=A0A2T2XAT8_9FIRM|nr:MAG: diaminopimelate epimerase [Sulfobacillus benefaciens]